MSYVDAFWNDEFFYDSFTLKNYTKDMQYNVFEKDELLHYEISLPGVSKEDMTIDTQIGEETFVHVKTKKEFDSNKKYRVKGIPSNFNFKIYVSDDFALEKAQAKVENGILHLTIPKKEEKVPKKFQIKVD